MYMGFGAFFVYGESYMQKKSLFMRGPKCTSMDGLKNKMDHENLKKLHENERGHENLPRSNEERFHLL